jgi:hypothetical protein
MGGAGRWHGLRLVVSDHPAILIRVRHYDVGPESELTLVDRSAGDGASHS